MKLSNYKNEIIISLTIIVSMFLLYSTLTLFGVDYSAFIQNGYFAPAVAVILITGTLLFKIATGRDIYAQASFGFKGALKLFVTFCMLLVLCGGLYVFATPFFP